MQPIIYDVAVSIDGYICGPDGDISAFPSTGPVVADYLARLETYAVALMGRATYEFGYGYGLAPGANPYPHMKTHVFSSTLTLPQDREVSVHSRLDAGWLNRLKASAGGPIYLCGGGRFAAQVLALGALDRLRLKRAPVLLGAGVPVFEGSAATALTCVGGCDYGQGLVFQEYTVGR